MRLIVGILLAVSMGICQARADRFHDKCPCGPDAIKGPLRLFLMQGHKDADFRPSCRIHDDCYECLGVSQKKCDDNFLENLLMACERSKQPRIARFKAKFAYWLVKNLGAGAYRKAQTKTAEGRR